MSRKCIVTKTGVMSGNNVSHAKNRTRRRFLPNLQRVSLYSESLKKFFSLRISTRGLKTIEHSGGLDNFLSKQTNSKLHCDLRSIKKQVDGALQ